MWRPEQFFFKPFDDGRIECIVEELINRQSQRIPLGVNIYGEVDSPGDHIKDLIKHTCFHLSTLDTKDRDESYDERGAFEVLDEEHDLINSFKLLQFLNELGCPEPVPQYIENRLKSIFQDKPEELKARLEASKIDEEFKSRIISAIATTQEEIRQLLAKTNFNLPRTAKTACYRYSCAIRVIDDRVPH